MAVSAPVISLDIDTRETDALLEQMRRVMTPQQFNWAVYGIMQRTSRHISRILKDNVTVDYRVTKGDVGRAVKTPKVTNGASGVGCVIPISEPMRVIGKHYTASGGRRGWGGKKKKKLKSVSAYAVTANIVKSGKSKLPSTMSSYGGNPPFRNLAFSKIAFTRKTHKRKPIVAIMAVPVPRMPMNLSKDAVQKDIADYLKGRVEARMRALVLNGR